MRIEAIKSFYETASDKVEKGKMEQTILKTINADKDTGDEKCHHLQTICMEEFAEAIQAVSKNMRVENDPDTRLSLIEELIDASICINILFTIYNVRVSESSKMLNVKLDRLNRRINEDGYYK